MYHFVTANTGLFVLLAVAMVVYAMYVQVRKFIHGYMYIPQHRITAPASVGHRHRKPAK